MDEAQDFLPEHDLRPDRSTALPPGLQSRGYLLGQGNIPLEVLVLEAAPSRTALREAWRARNGGRAAPLLVVALNGHDATLCGYAAEALGIYPMGRAQAERVCARALEEPDRNAALRYLADALPASRTDTDLPGFRNEGLLTDHVLRHHAAGAGTEIEAARRQGEAAAGAKDGELLRRLGFKAEKLTSTTSVLLAGEQRRAVAVLLQRNEVEEAASDRFGGWSPIMSALDTADKQGLPWVVMVQGDRVRLYPRELGVGVGRRGRTDTWVEVRTDLIRQDQAALLALVFSAEALRENGSLERLLAESKRFAAALADKLRERIYDEVVPRLATALFAARGVRQPTPDDLRLTYAMALTTLFRLLFVAYAEDRDFLPRTNEGYRRFALKTLAAELHENPPGPATGTQRWDDVRQLFDGVRDGRPDWGLPAYGGALFSDDSGVSRAGAELARTTLANAAFEPVLRALLLNDPRDFAVHGGPVDFRSLRVREFGTIYEGLLESELAIAEADLAIRRQGGEEVYAPARAGEPVAVKEGQAYLHNRSGARKSSGSYYTPGFAVDHLLDSALAPALEAHRARVLAEPDDIEASRAFFDFRVADIAMGSGHFLVAAMDRVEQALSSLLVARPLNGVKAELATLREAAFRALRNGREAEPGAPEPVTLSDQQLLRRLVAMRCIYGVDLNPLAVDLARLSLWIHGFVPGLPLAMLEARLRHGNALVGVATVRQVEERFREAGTLLFPVDAQSLLGDAMEHLARRARLADTTPADVAKARDAMAAAEVALGPTKALFDIMVAERVAPREIAFQFETWDQERPRIQRHPALRKAREVLAGLDVLHFPVAFPEVFTGTNPGFDVILGNPPWEKPMVEVHEFWARHFPGLRGLNTAERELRLAHLRRDRPDLAAELLAERAEAERERTVLTCGFFPGMGRGHADLYKAFAWRFWQLAAERGGRFGVVLPRAALTTPGLEDWRRDLFRESSSVEATTLVNRSGWVFGQVHHQFTIALLSVCRPGSRISGVVLRGPYAARRELEAGITRQPQQVEPAAVLEWTTLATLPLLPSEQSLPVFTTMRRAPRLAEVPTGGWRARAEQELNATSDRGLMTLEYDRHVWPVMKGESFDVWENDRGSKTYFAWAIPEEVRAHLISKRLRSARRSSESTYAALPAEWLRDEKTLGCNRPRIAFRDVTRATDSRTVRAALLPPRVFVNHTAPHLIWAGGDEMDQAFLLGMLCSVPLDWYARRFVELHLTFGILYDLPVPRPDRANPHWRRAVTLAGRLAASDDRFADWAAAVGVAHGPLDTTEKQRHIEELDAVVARLYGLTPPQLTHIFDTFHEWTREEQQRDWNARRDRTVAMLERLP
ncbi:Eco57I restriction-modification methylase domain-containing protein [Roseomonas sp. CCTCC AB2023176]|uniref:Eco57I restriction-modification methylase domain-containing protein n=1 Tax=Roseomonas sp. CCTCC AB2023176 TaxID=3342640 RepID=UPI0035E0272B